MEFPRLPLILLLLIESNSSLPNNSKKCFIFITTLCVWSNEHVGTERFCSDFINILPARREILN